MTARGRDLMARMARARPSGMQSLAELFAAQGGISRVYTVPGDLSFGLLAAFLAQGMLVTSCRSQATAVFAAAADTFATGTLQSLVLAPPRGPGVQNAMAAMTSTMANGLPVLLVSPTEDLGGMDCTGAFQAGTTRLDSSDGFIVDHIGNPDTACTQIARTLAACSGPRRSSALIEIPRSLLDADLAPPASPPAAHPQPTASDTLPDMAKVLAQARHPPAVVVGHMARWSLDLDALNTLCARLNAPPSARPD